MVEEILEAIAHIVCFGIGLRYRLQRRCRRRSRRRRHRCTLLSIAKLNSFIFRFEFISVCKL